MTDTPRSLLKNLQLDDYECDRLLGVPPHVPRILWIGCSDARVPESVADRAIGEIFVQRNIANQFQLSDTNAVSVLNYGLTGIKDDQGNPTIREIYVVGHAACGGIRACLGAADRTSPELTPPLSQWLGPLRTLADQYRGPSSTRPIREVQLTERNVWVQVNNVQAMLRTLGKSHIPVRAFVCELDGVRPFLRELRGQPRALA